MPDERIEEKLCCGRITPPRTSDRSSAVSLTRNGAWPRCCWPRPVKRSTRASGSFARAGVSPATVVRLSRQLGYEGFAALKIAVAQGGQRQSIRPPGCAGERVVGVASPGHGRGCSEHSRGGASVDARAFARTQRPSRAPGRCCSPVSAAPPRWPRWPRSSSQPSACPRPRRPTRSPSTCGPGPSVRTASAWPSATRGRAGTRSRR